MCSSVSLKHYFKSNEGKRLFEDASLDFANFMVCYYLCIDVIKAPSTSENDNKTMENAHLGMRGLHDGPISNLLLNEGSLIEMTSYA